MNHTDDDSSSSIFAPSPGPNKFQTFLFGAPSSSRPRLARSASTNRQQPRRLFRRPPRPGLTSVYASYHQPREGATASVALAMAIEIPSDPQQGIIKPVHINTDETPWTFSVAENDTASFSIYVKSELIQNELADATVVLMRFPADRLCFSPYASSHPHPHCQRDQRSTSQGTVSSRCLVYGMSADSPVHSCSCHALPICSFPNGIRKKLALSCLVPPVNPRHLRPRFRLCHHEPFTQIRFLFDASQLRDGYPSTALPPLPELIQSVDGAQTTTMNGSKQPRKSSFLHTLSRFGKDKHQSQSQSNPNSPLPTDSFSSLASTSPPSAPRPKIEGDADALPTYLTTIANHPTFKAARAWKRFVHVRTDDLQSQRVERTINVRGDRAGHISPISGVSPIGTNPWKDSRKSTETDEAVAPLSTTTATTLTGANTILTAPDAKDEPQPISPSSHPVSTADDSVRQDSQSSDMHDEDEGVQAADEHDDEDDAPTTPVLSRPQSQFIVHQATAVLDERPETPVQGHIVAESESLPSVIGTGTTVSTISTMPTSPESSTVEEIVKSLPSPTPAATVSAPTGPAPAPPAPVSQSNSRRSVSVDPRSRLSSADSASPKPRKVYPYQHHQHRPSQPVELDTEAEAGFDTDIEHPSDSVTALGDGHGAVTDTELLKGNNSFGSMLGLKQRKKKRKPSKKVSVNDFEMMRVLGKGCAGKVCAVEIVTNGT